MEDGVVKPRRGRLLRMTMNGMWCDETKEGEGLVRRGAEVETDGYWNVGRRNLIIHRSTETQT
jgi:hypothetical protein